MSDEEKEPRDGRRTGRWRDRFDAVAGRDAPLPMLVLGEDVDDVEDTTPEQLRRQAEEAEREIADRRRRAEAEIEAERARAQQELRIRQQEVDRRERALRRSERRVGRNHGSRRPGHGGVQKRAANPHWWVAISALGGVVTLFTAGVLSGGHTDHPALNSYRDEQLTYVHWQRAALQVDLDVARRLDGQAMTTVGDDTASVGLIRQSVEGSDETPRYYIDRAADAMAVVSDPGTSPEAVLAQWWELRELPESAAPASTHDAKLAEMTDVDAAPYILAIAAMALFASLAVIAFTNASVLVGVLGVLAAVMAIVVGTAAPAPDRVERAVQAHQEEMAEVRALVDEVGTTLGDAYLHTSANAAWNIELGEDEAGTPAGQAFVSAQEALEEATRTGEDEQVYAAAVTYVESAQELLEVRIADLEEARVAVDDSLARPQDVVNRTFWPSAVGILAGGTAAGLSTVRAVRMDRGVVAPVERRKDRA